MPIVNFRWDDLTDDIHQEVDETGNIDVSYTHKPELYGHVIMQRRGTTKSFYHFDGVGSTRKLTNINQVALNTYKFSGFGETVAETGSTENPFQFVGKSGYYADDELNSLYIRRRVYKPTIGRWVSLDPLGFIDGPNVFTYANSDPINLADPTGLFCDECPYPPGEGTCHGKPIGVQFVGGRGRFLNPEVREYGPQGFWTYVGSSFWMRWDPDHNQFIDEDGCCCCDLVGVIQTYSEYVSYSGDWSSIHAGSGNPWHVDGTIPYALQKTMNPCDKWSQPQVVSSRDRPSAPVRWKGFGKKLRHLAQDFWTCVVCLAGNEGYNLKTVLEPAFGQQQYWYQVEGITVYGCVKWGHSIYWSEAGQTWRYQRYVNDVFGVGDDDDFAVVDRDAPNHPPPKVKWSDPVLSLVFPSH